MNKRPPHSANPDCQSVLHETAPIGAKFNNSNDGNC